MTSEIVIICGPTASGKSARAIDIAQQRGGVIINADAMQVYHELDVLTARPSAEDLARVPHLLYGALPVSESCSAARWLKLADEAIRATWAEGKLPIVTGGTGLYIKALMEGLSAIPDVPPETRAEATKLWENEREQALERLDLAMSMRLKAGDTQRHIRALEVMLTTGKSLLYWQEQPRQKLYADANFTVEYIDMPRFALYVRCNARFLKMMEKGAEAEVRALLALGIADDKPAMRAVGVPELAGYINGEWDLFEATRRAQQATRNYAKRQVTWFKHQLPSHS